MPYKLIIFIFLPAALTGQAARAVPLGRGRLAAAAAGSSSAAAPAEIMVRVRPHVVVQPGSEVKLAQLMDAQGISAPTRAKLESTVISQAPSYGEKQELSQASLRDVLREVVAMEKVNSGHAVHLVLPQQVTIDTVKRGISAESVGTELAQAWRPLCGDCQLELDGLSLPKVEKVRDWTLKIKPELPHGGFSVPVDLIRENGSVVPAWVTGRLAVKRRVPVLTRLLAIGDRVQPQDVVWEYRDTSYSYDGVPGADELVGKRLKQGLRAGDVILQGMLEKERAIRRGELVQVRSGEGQWEITLSVVAQQDAFVGDVITLKNPRTNATFVGQVTGQGEVELR